MIPGPPRYTLFPYTPLFRSEPIQQITQAPIPESGEPGLPIHWLEDAFGSVPKNQSRAVNPVALLYEGEVPNNLVWRPGVGSFVAGDPVVREVREHGPKHVRSSTKHFRAELEREVHGFSIVGERRLASPRHLTVVKVRSKSSPSSTSRRSRAPVFVDSLIAAL